MPPRWLCGLIVVFWLATTGWLFWNDLGPSWRQGEPPPFNIDLVAEVQKNGQSERIHWTVLRQLPNESEPMPVFRASTWLDYHLEDDTCSFRASLGTNQDKDLTPFLVARILRIDRMTSEYRVTRSGQLRALHADVRAIPEPWRVKQDLSLFMPWLKQRSGEGAKNTPSRHDSLELGIWGEVRDNQFIVHCRAGSGDIDHPMQFDLPPTPLSRTNSVLMPLHPVNRIRGLRLGQSWRQPLVDPLRDAFAALPGFSGGVRTLQAQVLPQTQVLVRGEVEIPCLVIEYTDEEHEIVGRTWVEEDSEQVQQQEALLDDIHWIMKRDGLPRRLRRSS
jgi:hypothetical protein